MIDETRYRRTEAIFQRAVELAPAEREAFVVRECGDDAEMIALVGRLLGHAESGAALTDVHGELVAAPPADATDAVGTTIGPYVLRELIGEGGFGVVYRAEQTAPVHREVAVKIIKPGMDTKRVIARFEAERQALAMMDHPSISKVLEAGATANARPYFVMELVRGVPITAFCDRAQLTIDERVALFVRVCDAVQHAHQKGIIHRDLKPSNVLVTLHGTTAVPTIIDFGIAKAMHRSLTEKTLVTEQHQFVGTVEYMSPEQAEPGGLDVDTRSDIYSLGVMLYELLTGTTPIDSATVQQATIGEIERLVREVEPPRPSTRLGAIGAELAAVARDRGAEPASLTRRVRGDLDWIVMTAIDKDRSRRYATTADLARDLERALANEAVLARPPSRPYKLRKFVARNRLLVASAALIGVVVAVAGAGMIWTTFSAREAARRAESINEFMEWALLSSDPAQGNANARLLDLLLSAADEVDERFGDHPLIEARVRELIGTGFHNLTRQHDALPQFEAAYQIYAARLPADDPRVIRLKYRRSASLLFVMRVDEAVTLANEVLAHESVDETIALKTRVVLAHAQQRRGDAGGAAASLRTIVGDMDRQLGEDHYLTCMTRSGFGAMLALVARTGDAAERDATFREAADVLSGVVARTERVFAEDAYPTVTGLRHLLEVRFLQRDQAETRRLAELVIARTRSRLGEDHAFSRAAMNRLAWACYWEGRQADAAAWMTESIEGRRRTRGDRDAMTLASMSDGLEVLWAGHGDAEGEAYARILVERFSATMGPESQLALEYRVYHAHFLTNLGRLDEARPMVDALRGKEASLSRPHMQTLLRKLTDRYDAG